MDDDIKALTEASETLEERVRDYETRLEVLTQENDSSARSTAPRSSAWRPSEWTRATAFRD
ncbi:unnamed protein product [Ascophyllum nodosum]